MAMLVQYANKSTLIFVGNMNLLNKQLAKNEHVSMNYTKYILIICLMQPKPKPIKNSSMHGTIYH